MSAVIRTLRHHLVLTILLAALACGASAPATAATWEGMPYPYNVVRESVRDALTNFGYNADLRMMISPDVSGTVDGYRGKGTARQFLDDITRTSGLDWYSDGAVIYVSPAADEQTAIVPLNGFSINVIKKQLEAQKLSDARFHMSQQIGGDGAVLSGPPSYVAVMRQAIESLVSERKVLKVDASRSLVIFRGSQSSSVTVR